MSDDTRSAPPGVTGQATTREFLAVMFRRKWIILGLLLVTTATVMVISLTTPVAYISSGRVLYKRGEQVSVLEPDRRLYGDWEQELGSELQLVKSVPVLESARVLLKRSAGPARRPFGIAINNVDVEVMGKSNVIAIGYHDRDPEAAQAVCDALIRAYMDYRENQLGVSYPKGFFDSELAEVERQLVQRTEDRRRYFLERGLADVPEQTRALILQLTSLQQQRSQTELDVSEARAQMEAIRELQKQPEMDLPLPSSPTGMDLVQMLKQRVLEQEARVAQLKERYRDESPEITNAIGTLDAMRAMLKREVESRLEVQSSRTQVLETRLTALRTEERRLQDQLDAMPASEARTSTLDREIVTLKDRQKDLLEKSDRAKVNENVVSRARLILLSPAGPAIPTNARDYVRLALAPAFSLVVGIGLSFFIDGLDITVRTANHAEEAVELPVLATLPERRRRRTAS